MDLFLPRTTAFLNAKIKENGNVLVAVEGGVVVEAIRNVIIQSIPFLTLKDDRVEVASIVDGGIYMGEAKIVLIKPLNVANLKIVEIKNTIFMDVGIKSVGRTNFFYVLDVKVRGIGVKDNIKVEGGINVGSITKLIVVVFLSDSFINLDN